MFSHDPWIDLGSAAGRRRGLVVGLHGGSGCLQGERDGDDVPVREAELRLQEPRIPAWSGPRVDHVAPPER